MDLSGIKRLEPLLTSPCSFLRELAKALKALKEKFEIALDFLERGLISPDYAYLRLKIILKHKEKKYETLVYLDTMTHYLGKSSCFAIADPLLKHTYDFVSISYMRATLNFRLRKYEKSLDHKKHKVSL